MFIELIQYIFLLLISHSINSCSASTQMVVVWGKLLDGHNCTSTTSITDWDECYTTCASSTTCTAAYLSAGSCDLCQTSESFTAQEVDPNSGDKIPTPFSECPAIPFNGTSREGSMLLTSTLNVSYILIEDSGYFRYIYSVIKICPEGWQRFERASGTRCLRVFKQDTAVNNAQAEQLCQQQDAILSGIENQNEVDFIQRIFYFVRVESSESMPPTSQSGIVGVWLGARRLSSCRGKDWRSYPGCSEKSFEWTDPSITGTAGFVFAAKQPDGVIDANNNQQDCLFLYSNSGQIEDHYCTATCEIDGKCRYKMLSYVCSRPPG
ncbi:unnamed protein product [Caenorhabditis bovis]|uniref:C-type lectin domain-containing protein n=1 Tax=Caenorhabditis bovis TaxID=2654633 RepID=A0A8S1EDI8_9PELO|nr:unnamed protein product [Caenorhabditis bovis]